MKKEVIQFIKSHNFIKGFILTTSAVLAVWVSNLIGQPNAGLGLASGVLLAAPSDIPGSRKHNIIGVLTAIFLAVFSTVTINIFNTSVYIIIPILALVVFINAYIAVYGFRASLIAFSGLLAIALSFAHKKIGIDIAYSALYIIIGGLWYLFATLIFSIFKPRLQAEEHISECMQLTAKYLETRAKIVTEKKRLDLLKELLTLQTSLNESHETLRAILLNTRKKSGGSNYIRQQTLVFIELIDILELAMANPVNYDQMDKDFENHQEVFQPFIKLLNTLALHLKALSYTVSGKTKKIKPIDFDLLIQDVQKAISRYKSQVEIKSNQNKILTLRNLSDYEFQQVEKIKRIERILRNNHPIEKETNNVEIQKFLTPQPYDFKTLRDNFNLQSPIFKHALRLAVTVVVGFILGNIFSIQNAYWIILTIFVIMRPNYGLTKERSKHRIIGTLLGSAIATIIILITHNTIVYGVVFYISLILAFSFIQQNYKTAATFITLSIIFVYALLQPNAFAVIQYRVIDTLIGALLAIIANHTLWPAWESYNIKNVFLETLKASSSYILETGELYKNPKKNITTYKLSRKQAFLAIGNLNAAFQRMTQEPKHQQEQVGKTFAIVVTLQTILSSAASLGSFIQHHPTTKASKQFEGALNAIIAELSNIYHVVNRTYKDDLTIALKADEMQQFLQEKYTSLKDIRQQELEEGKNEISKEMRAKLQEAYLISDQLVYLYGLTLNLKKAIEDYLKLEQQIKAT
ncbi:FUSC family protein [Zhouia sp. PK063]|uniref:FUSC family protein n=1 Tax=Zhouia sp. PK063 TaxID=3373602 RepID=UPI0037AEC381